MAKKKKTYKTSGKPKVAAMNEYIYKNIRESDYKVNRPGKPKKIYKQQVAQRTNLKVYKASPAELARSKYKGPKFSKLPGASKPMPTTVAKGFKVGDPRYVPRVPYAPEPGYKAPSQMPVQKQKAKGFIKPQRLGGYAGKSSPLNQKFIKEASKPMSATAKKALLTRGAKVAVKGASRLIPGVGTALLVKDVYDVAKWASKQPKVKKVSKIYGSKINKSYKYNR
tara:strand:- start:2246 stop:2917 length:672 start_codon:yes stop_codon:yes gene_type:complete